MTNEHAVWVYAVAAGIEPDWLAGVPGVGGAPVRRVAAGGLAAAVSSVSLAEFGAEPLRRNLESLDWLERTARAHHDVIDAVACHAPVIPLRLAAVYHDDTSVAALLDDRGEDFADALARVTGRAEWGVKAYSVPDRASAEPAAGAPAAAAAPRRAGQGADYLRRRRDELSAADHARRSAAAAAEDLHSALLQAAEAGELKPPQVRQLAQQPEPMILNGTYLIDDERSGAFAALVSDLAGRLSGLRVELTGPWPPYSFGALPEDAP